MKRNDIDSIINDVLNEEFNKNLIYYLKRGLRRMLMRNWLENNQRLIRTRMARLMLKISNY